MKKHILSAVVVSTLFVACTKSTTTEKTENPDGSVTTTTTTEIGTGLIDSSKVDKAKNDIQNTVDNASDKIDNTAQKSKRRHQQSR